MEERIVLGTTIASNGKVRFLLKGDTTPVWGSLLNGRELPKSGSTVYIVKEPMKTGNGEWTNVYW